MEELFGQKNVKLVFTKESLDIPILVQTAVVIDLAKISIVLKLFILLLLMLFWIDVVSFLLLIVAIVMLLFVVDHCNSQGDWVLSFCVMPQLCR